MGFWGALKGIGKIASLSNPWLGGGLMAAGLIGGGLRNRNPNKIDARERQMFDLTTRGLYDPAYSNVHNPIIDDSRGVYDMRQRLRDITMPSLQAGMFTPQNMNFRGVGYAGQAPRPTFNLTKPGEERITGNAMTGGYDPSLPDGAQTLTGNALAPSYSITQGDDGLGADIKQTMTSGMSRDQIDAMRLPGSANYTGGRSTASYGAGGAGTAMSAPSYKPAMQTGFLAGESDTYDMPVDLPPEYTSQLDPALDTRMQEQAMMGLDLPDFDTFKAGLLDQTMADINSHYAGRGLSGSGMNMDDMSRAVARLNMDIANNMAGLRSRGLADARGVSGDIYGRGMDTYKTNADMFFRNLDAAETLRANRLNERLLPYQMAMRMSDQAPINPNMATGNLGRSYNLGRSSGGGGLFDLGSEMLLRRYGG